VENPKNVKKSFQMWLWWELPAIGVSSILVLLASARYDFLERITGFCERHEQWELDEVLVLTLFLTLCFLWLAIRRGRESERIKQRLARRSKELQRALDDVHQLQGILPICASCKKIRDEEGSWCQLETYISDHTEADFSHGICPDCRRSLYADFLDPEEQAGGDGGAPGTDA
jgi:hypothetical protein